MRKRRKNQLKLTIKVIAIMVVALFVYQFRVDISKFIWEHQSPRMMEVLLKE